MIQVHVCIYSVIVARCVVIVIKVVHSEKGGGDFVYFIITISKTANKYQKFIMQTLF
jgi:hypothetical protein